MCLGTDTAGARMRPGPNSSLQGYNGQTVEGHTVKNAPKCIHAHGLTCLPISLSVSLSPSVNWAPSCRKCCEPNWKDSEPTRASTKILPRQETAITTKRYLHHKILRGRPRLRRNVRCAPWHALRRRRTNRRHAMIRPRLHEAQTSNHAITRLDTCRRHKARSFL